MIDQLPKGADDDLLIRHNTGGGERKLDIQLGAVTPKRWYANVLAHNPRMMRRHVSAKARLVDRMHPRGHDRGERLAAELVGAPEEELSRGSVDEANPPLLVRHDDGVGQQFEGRNASIPSD
jgi:hypothetical protein